MVREHPHAPGPHIYTYPGVYLMMTVATSIKAPLFENVPTVLRERPQWVNWRLEERDGKNTKVPYIPGTLRRASSTDLMTWRTFDEAIAAYERAEPPYDGIGFVFCSADPFVGIDIDGCRNPETGEIEESAQAIIDTFAEESYVESSPSGTGVHIITSGRQREGVRRGGIEIYGQDRYFTISGVQLS